MEHRKFGKLLHQLHELTVAQAEKVVAALHRRDSGDAVRHIVLFQARMSAGSSFSVLG